MSAPARPAVVPLAPEDVARADRVARRLHSEISALVAAMPASARNASGLSRHLGIDRTTCQRAVFAVSRPYAGPELFSMLPGVRGLQQLVDAASASWPEADRAVIDGLATAIEQFQSLLTSLGGSHSRLVRRLERGPRSDAGATLPARTHDESPTRDARTKLFEAAAELTGRHSDCWVAVYVYRQVPGLPRTLEVSRAHGLIGHVARADAVPLVVQNFSSRPDGDPDGGPDRFVTLDDGDVQGRTLGPVLRDFTTDPPPLVTSKQPQEFLVQSIDERTSSLDRPIDLMLATRTRIPHPTHQARPVEEAWALINFPCRHLLFDIWLERDLARSCIPSLDVHLWRPDFAQQSGDRWQTRFADAPSLQLLGSGPRRTAPRAWPRMPELTHYVFDRLGASPAQFVGFRCDVDYPVWRAGYCVSFDFTRPQPEASGEPT
jgi:hypothetical protein